MYSVKNKVDFQPIMSTIEERFQAAVNVIKGLPKNGPYQPSTAMMLKFYGLYKQATEGPCHHKKPAFWDIIGKAKWDAWKDNHNLNKEQAMQRYVDGLREIIETMSFTENVQNFVGSISGLDNINLDELDMIVPGMREIAESHPNSPFNSRTNSPQHGASANGTTAEELHAVPNTNGHTTLHLNGGGDHINDDDDDERVGETDAIQIAQALPTVPILSHRSDFFASPYDTMPNANVDAADLSEDEYGDPVDLQHDLTEAMVHNSELLKQIQATVLRMNADLAAVNHRMNSLEKVVNEVRASVMNKTKSASSSRTGGRQNPKWWPFDDISPAWFVLLVLWPFVVRRISCMLMTAPRRK